MSHILYPQMDPGWPASLSPVIAGDLLRREMNFDGVVMTDDLDMGAIKNHHGIETVIHQVLSADIDIALICHKGPDIQKAFNTIRSALITSPELKAKGAESIRRVMTLKKKFLL